MRRPGVVGVVLLGSTAVSADASGARRPVRVEAETTNPVPVPKFLACDATNQHCLISYDTTSQVVGDMRGTVVSSGSLNADLSQGTYQTTLLGMFTGEIDGCGSGTLALSWPLVAGGSAAFSGDLDVVEGSGTAGLAGVSGSGSFAVTPGDAANTTVYRLRLRCRPTAATGCCNPSDTSGCNGCARRANWSTRGGDTASIGPRGQSGSGRGANASTSPGYVNRSTTSWRCWSGRWCPSATSPTGCSARSPTPRSGPGAGRTSIAPATGSSPIDPAVPVGRGPSAPLRSRRRSSTAATTC